MSNREQTMGIDYFCIETDIMLDDKVFALRYHYATENGGNDTAAGYAAFGRLVDLLADIYREGFAAEITPQRRIRLSQQMGMLPDELDEFIGTCVDCGLFDRNFWENNQVLTSKGIQKRYYIVAKRRQGSIPESQRKWLLIKDGQDHDDADSEHDDSTLQHDVTTSQQDVTTLQRDEETCPLRKDKDKEEDKEKKSKRKVKEEEKRSASAKPSDLVSSLSKQFSSPLDKRQKRHHQPYALSCFSLVGGDRLYDDGMDGKHDSPWDALAMRLKYKAPDCDMQSLAAKVLETCPPDCPESAECVSQCYGLICGALDKFDRSKRPSPIPLIVKVLTEDRKEVQ